jgi:hypothetical protein
MRVTSVPTRRFALLTLLGLVAAVAVAACGDELPSNTGPVAAPGVDAASEQTAGDETSSEADPADDAASAPAESDSDGSEALGPSGGPGIGAREDTLFEALEVHIAALNALDERKFVSIFLDDCDDPAAAGALSYSFGAPLVKAGGQASSEFESILFLDTDRALVEYATELPRDIWVVHERRWRISTCPQ